VRLSLAFNQIGSLVVLIASLSGCDQGNGKAVSDAVKVPEPSAQTVQEPSKADAAPPAVPTITPPAPPAVSTVDDATPTYTVQCAANAAAAEQCQVDKLTYVGWRTFATQCQVCHGGSALGSTFAPNLLDRLNQRVNYARFKDVVANGFRGQVGAMPAWKTNPQVMPHIDDLYRYLRARADGKLPAGRPQHST
jgi:mono/diheme cytochrome c family protein